MSFLTVFSILLTVVLLFLVIGFAYKIFSTKSKMEILNNTIQILNNENSDLKSALMTVNKESKDLSNENIRLTEELKHIQINLENEKKNYTHLQTQLKDQFNLIAKDVIDANSKNFFSMAKNVLDQESKSYQNTMQEKEKNLLNLISPLSETLEKYQKHIFELEKERGKSFQQLEGELKRVIQGQDSLYQTTTALKDALKKPHIRGRWGEMQLKNCIELAGMSEYADVNFQSSFQGDDGLLIPDMTVKMPGGHVVIVDSKTPIDAFLESLETTSDAERSNQMLRHGKHVREHVKKLATRAYNDQIKESADFTVMFLPNESFLYAALETQADLVEFALQRKILIATPPTLIGLLKVIRYGWNEDKIAENAEKIADAGKELHARVALFIEAFEAIGKNLDKAKSEYDKGLKRLNSKVLVQAKRLESLGAKSNKELPSSIDSTL